MKVEPDPKVGEIIVLCPGAAPGRCKHDNGYAVKSEEHSMSRPMGHFREVTTFECRDCYYSTRKYLSDWKTEGSRF